MLTSLAQISATTVKILSQKLKKGRGEAAPGLVALKIDPDFIANKHQHIKTKILITGTNGKTTTTNLINQLLSDQNIDLITNINGSNLERGIASALLNYNQQNTALWECDEAAFVKIAAQVKPTHIIINNLFRDQLDRYGEINTLLDKWIETLKKLPKCNLIINSDDPNLVFLSKQASHHQIYFYSLKTTKFNRILHSADALFCPNCSKPIEYSRINFSHLGEYSCSCGFSHPQPNLTISKSKNNNLKVITKNNSTEIETQLKGDYNLYNIAASLSLSRLLNIDIKKSINIVKSFKAVKGRQEIINYKNKNVHLYLVKNPTGFDQVVDTLTDLDKKITVLTALNDNIADGTDVSWIWDTNFEKLCQIAKKIIITGDRVHDLTLRFKYSDFDLDKLVIKTSKQQAINYLSDQKDKDIYILPTYTALWQLRKILLKSKS